MKPPYNADELNKRRRQIEMRTGLTLDSLQEHVDRLRRANEEQGWDHLSFEDAYNYPGVSKQAASHVENCTYCQNLVETIHPPDDLFQPIGDTARKFYLPRRSRLAGLIGPRWSIIAWSALLFVALLSLWVHRGVVSANNRLAQTIEAAPRWSTGATFAAMLYEDRLDARELTPVLEKGLELQRQKKTDDRIGEGAALVNLAHFLRAKDPDAALGYYDQAFELRGEYTQFAEQAAALKELGDYYRRSDVDRTLSMYAHAHHLLGIVSAPYRYTVMKKEEALVNLGTTFDLAQKHIFATNVGSVDFFLEDTAYLEQNRQTVEHGVPVVRFYLYNSRYPGQSRERIEKTHAEAQTTCSALFDLADPQIRDVVGHVREILVVDGGFVAEVPDLAYDEETGWSFETIFGSTEPIHISSAQEYLRRLEAVAHHAAWLYADDEVTARLLENAPGLRNETMMSASQVCKSVLDRLGDS